MIPGYPRGSRLLLLNTIYYKSQKQKDGKWSDDAIALIVKDLNTGEKFQHTIYNPDYEYFRAKDDVQIDHNLLFIEQDKVEPVRIPYRDVLKSIAKESGKTEFFYDNIRSGNRYANNQLFMYERIFNADMDIEDHYRFRFDKYYLQDEIPEPSLMYFDIEVDIKDIAGDFPFPGEAPINVMTLVDSTSKDVYTMILRDYGNPEVEKFEKELSTEFGYTKFIQEIKNNILEKSCKGNKKIYDSLDVDNLSFGINFYDEEIQMIQDLFDIINDLKRDFILAWNMAFDIPYIIERIRALGYDPAEIMSHPDFPIPNAYYYLDERAQEFSEKGDFARISSYTVYVDHLVQYASRRKGQSRPKSFSLDFIANLTTKMGKLDYSHITRDIAEFPYLDFPLFTIYNIIDTLAQRAVESKMGDIGYLNTKAISNNTRLHKAHRQTIYLTNRLIKELNSAGFITGNNVNKFKPKPTKKFAGALVGDPTHLEDDHLMKLNGVPVRMADNADDFDFSSLYPSIMEEFNIAPNTELGKIVIDEELPHVNPFNNDKFDNGGIFVEDYISGNVIETCKRWFNLPDIMDMKDIITKYMMENRPRNAEDYYDVRTGLINPFFEHEEFQMECPFDIVTEPYNPFHVLKKMPDIEEV